MDEHQVETSDGHVLLMYNVKPRDFKNENGKAILLLHGLCHSSGVFVCNREDSLAFYLADKGFNVWLGNNRGFNEHKVHTKLESKFWVWSLDEMASFDFPAMVDFVISKTGVEKIVFVGHSQGNAQAFLSLCSDSKIHKKIEIVIALAPAFYVKEFKRWPLNLISSLSRIEFFERFGFHEFLPIIRKLQLKLPLFLVSPMAFRVLKQVFGTCDKNWHKSRKKAYFQFTSNAISSKLVQHWIQVSKRGQIHFFNDPEPLDLSKIECPVAIFGAEEDTLVKASLDQFSEIRKLVHFEVVPGYNHLDVLWAKDVEMKIFSKIVELIKSPC